MKITQNCLVPNMPESVYHDDPCDTPSLSASTLADLIEKTEKEAMLNNRRLNPNWKQEDDEETDGSQIGTIAHDFVLRGERGTYEIANFKDWRTNDAKAAKESIESRGLIALNTTTAERTIPVVQAMKAALFEQLAEHRDYPGIMRQGRGEVSGFAHDGKIWNRARFDWLEESPQFSDLTIDYKTTGLGFDQWEKQVLWGPSAKYLQKKHYTRVRELITEKPSRFIFVVQRIKAPFLVRIFEIDRSCDDAVDARYNNGYKRFVNCLKTGVWKGEPPVSFHSYPPPWVVQKWEIDETNEHILASQEKAETSTQNVAMAG